MSSLAEQQTTENAAYRLLVIAFLLPLAHPFEHGQIIFKLIFVVLSIVTNARVFQTIFTVPLSGCRSPTSVFSSVDLPTPLVPSTASFSPTSSSRLRFFKQWTVIKPFGQTFHFQRVTEQFLILFKTDERVLTAGGFHLFQFDFINLARARSCPGEISRRWR